MTQAAHHELTQRDVAVIGAGVAGLACALELIHAGHSVVVVERDSAPGGHTAKYCCKATDGCRVCGACRFEALLEEFCAQERSELLLRTTLDIVERIGEDFRITLTRDTDSGRSVLKAQVSAVVLACGFKPFDPAEKPRFGYGTVPGVITGLELDSMLRDGPKNGKSLPQRLNKIAFIQCVGSRDPKIGRNYCSRVCCGYAFHLARLLKSRFPSTDASIFYMDAQTFARSFDRELAEAQSELRLIRAIPGGVHATEDGRAELVYQSADDRRVTESFDLVVLSVGISPDPSHAALGALFEVGLNEDGFLGGNADSVETRTPGVFTAGTVQGPKSIADSISHAYSAAARVTTYLRTLGRMAAP
jgi:heterodisulfide reductase subunit A